MNTTYSEGEVNKRESICFDRCVAKYFGRSTPRSGEHMQKAWSERSHEALSDIQSYIHDEPKWTLFSLFLNVVLPSLLLFCFSFMCIFFFMPVFNLFFPLAYLDTALVGLLWPALFCLLCVHSKSDDDITIRFLESLERPPWSYMCA